MSSHTELIVWQRAMALVTVIYKMTTSFPKHEMFGLTSQIQRSAVSIPSNIAEGRSRGTRKDFCQFLHIALGSCAELETQIEIARSLSYGDKGMYNEIEQATAEIFRMLRAMLAKLESKTLSAKP
ncbi:MAG: hypothetical protein A3C06_03510 [Candidatus Taylorbacteria bacterium RIFCSPHIGHO2_02_FULL_46_13]|uniref:Four helix bundle protein n=1 Tax=Candidatus Taylorbacteria bacterium RIFCSPHIGHO2_02_FULL_46_13 TaxID=1802312 RepID=A0A1G2MR36_9BACT|nr:MAG: hypothetical protein A3C06_03510 [Candidatus Taylorbacteria bacterium RIFCSPHIGHO2_02_FULL_46_13]